MAVELIDVAKLVAAGFVGGYVSYIFEKRKQTFAKNLEEKRKIYNEFTSMVVDLLNPSTSGKITKKGKVEEEFIDKFYDFYKRFILYASGKSVEAFGEWMTYLRKDKMDNKEWINKLSGLLGSMREDLGLSNYRLGRNNEALLRAILTDFDEVYSRK